MWCRSFSSAAKISDGPSSGANRYHRCRQLPQRAHCQALQMAIASGGSIFYLVLGSSAERDIYCDLNMQSWKICEHASVQPSVWTPDSKVPSGISISALIAPRSWDGEENKKEISSPQNVFGLWMILSCAGPHRHVISNVTASQEQKKKSCCLILILQQPTSVTMAHQLILQSGVKDAYGKI